MTGNCTISSAGHPPPVLVHASGEAECLDVPTGPPLGQGIARYTVVERRLPEGSILLLSNTALLSTDQAPGHPRVPLDRLGLTTTTHASLQDMCDAIVDTLAPEQPSQDTAFLLARTRTFDAGRTASWRLPNAPEVVSRARKLASTQLADWGMSGLADGTALIVSELVTNAVRYADGPIELRLIRDQALICEVTDDSSTAPTCAAPTTPMRAAAACTSPRNSPTAGASAPHPAARPSGLNNPFPQPLLTPSTLTSRGMTLIDGRMGMRKWAAGLRRGARSAGPVAFPRPAARAETRGPGGMRARCRACWHDRVSHFVEQLLERLADA